MCILLVLIRQQGQGVVEVSGHDHETKSTETIQYIPEVEAVYHIWLFFMLSP